MTRRVAPAPPGVPALEPIRQDLYDTKHQVTVGPVGNLEFFRSPSNLGNLYTNMQGNGQLPYPQQYHVFGMAIEILPSIGVSWDSSQLDPSQANKKKLIELAYVKFNIGSKDYLTLPLKRVPAGLGIQGVGAGAQNPGIFYTNGIQDIQHYVDVTIRQGGKIKPIHIPAQQAFNVKIIWPDGAPAVLIDWDIRVYLVGILWREVQ